MAVTEVDVRVDVHEGVPGAPIAGLVLRATPVTAAAGVELEPVSIPVAATGGTRLALPPGAIWRVEAEGEGIWSTAVLVSSDRPQPEASLAVFPAGSLRLALRLPGGAKPPAEATVRFEAAPGGPPLALSSTLCPLTGAVLECALPGVDLDLVVKLPGFAGVHLFDLPVRAGQLLDLGERQLVAGGSIVARIARADGGPLPEKTAVRLEIDAATGAASRELLAAAEQFPPLSPSRRGFVQFTAVAPGSYRLVGTAPDGSQAVAGGLVLPGDVELELRAPLVLLPPQDLEIAVVPPLGVDGTPWVVESGREGSDGSVPALDRRAVGPEGRALLERLSPGRYHVGIVDAAGARMASGVAEVPGAGRLELTIDQVEIAGEVTLGGAPLAAELWFGGRSGAVRIRMESDEEGTFGGWLPRTGSWSVDVSAPTAQVERRIGGVEVARAAAGGPARVEIRLPDSRLSGRVVDSQRRPVPGAIVTVQVPGEGTAFFLRSGEQGEFLSRGLGEGKIVVSAQGFVAGEGVAEASPVEVTVGEERTDPDEVELVLGANRTLRGRVIGIQGEPIAGAMIQVAALAGVHPAAGELRYAVSGLDGGFSVDLPATADRAFVFHGAGGGRSLRALAVDPRSGTPLTLVSDPAGGEIVLRSKSALAPGGPAARIPVFFQDGVLVPVGVYSSWAQREARFSATNGNELRIPRLAPGAYAICVVEPEERLALELAPGAFAPGPSCHREYLPPGGVIELEY
ncbi:MAG: hypothetical protein BWX64_00038 [Acidobacteria bacterium ADurb.Bin051]|nr:MAG: hypothetical protein BWX64_00038 [Acidobacteria bacterium ADurb.Bin051]